VAQAAVFLMLKHRIRVILPPRFLCCGFPSLANAASDQHNRLVLRNTIIFHQIRDMLGHMIFDACAVTCGTCRESLVRMDVSGIFEAPIRDVSDLVVSEIRLSKTGGTCLYHAPCHDSLEGSGLDLLQTARYRPIRFPHCCAEAGTLAVSTPAIARAMRDRKQEGLRDIQNEHGTPCTILTNCPACLQGLGRLEGGIAEDLAMAAGGPRWKNELKRLLQ
jgi:Fe-S oxidoreductase